MKILYVTTISNTVNAFLIPHIKMLIDEGNHVDVAFNIEQDPKGEIKKMGCSVYNIPFQRSPLKLDNYKAYKVLKETVIKGNYDIVHTHTPVASALVRIACKKIKNTSVIYTAHGFHFFKGAPIRNWLFYYSMEKLLSIWTESIITMNSEDYMNAKKIVGRGKCKVHYVNGVGVELTKFSPLSKNETSTIRKNLGYSEKDYIIVYVGELSKRKNQAQLIKAIKELKKQDFQVKLLIIGSGALEAYYKNLTTRLDLDGCIDFLGYRTDISKIMAMSDVAVSSSRQEGLPVNIMEAMATGLPLVVTNSRGNRDLVRDGLNGYIVELNDSSEMADKILKMYLSPELRSLFKRNNLKLIKDYSVENLLEQMREIYSNYIPQFKEI